MNYLTKQQILTGLTGLAERDYESFALGGRLRLRELTRGAYKRAAEQSGDPDRFHLLVAAGAIINPETGLPMFAPDELLAVIEGDDPDGRALRWQAARDIAVAALDLGEVGPEYLKSGDSAADAG